MVANSINHFIAGPRVSNLKSVFSTCLRNFFPSYCLMDENKSVLHCNLYKEVSVHVHGLGVPLRG